MTLTKEDDPEKTIKLHEEFYSARGESKVTLRACLY